MKLGFVPSSGWLQSPHDTRNRVCWHLVGISLVLRLSTHLCVQVEDYLSTFVYKISMSSRNDDNSAILFWAAKCINHNGHYWNPLKILAINSSLHQTETHRIFLTPSQIKPLLTCFMDGKTSLKCCCHQRSWISV